MVVVVMKRCGRESYWSIHTVGRDLVTVIMGRHRQGKAQGLRTRDQGTIRD